MPFVIYADTESLLVKCDNVEEQGEDEGKSSTKDDREIFYKRDGISDVLVHRMSNLLMENSMMR